MLTIKVSEGDVITGLKAARRNMRKTVRQSAGEAATRIVLPSVKRHASPHVGPFVTALRARATNSGSGYITATSVKKARVIGLQNWGGTVRPYIYPRQKLALTVGDGVVAKVKTPRHYTGKKFIEAGIRDRLDEFETHVGNDVLTAIKKQAS